MSSYLQSFAERFATLDTHNLDLLNDLYSEDVAFRDPLHQLTGLPALRAYFAQLYAKVPECHYRFEGTDELEPGHGYILLDLAISPPAAGPWAADQPAGLQPPALA